MIDLTLTPMTPLTKEFRHTQIGEEEILVPELSFSVHRFGNRFLKISAKHFPKPILLVSIIKLDLTAFYRRKAT